MIGKTDLVVVDFCATTQDCTHGVIGVLLGNGDGTFQAAVSFPSGGTEPQSVAVGNFDGDGKPDLALAQCTNLDACSDGSAGIVSVLLGNGDGSFRSAVSYSSGDPFAEAVVAGDFNGDGKLDLAVANGNCAEVGLAVSCGTGSVGILLGNGDGTFQPAVRYSTIDDHAFSVLADDFNGDGKLDLVVGNTNCAATFLVPCNDGSVAVFLGKGDGTFASAVTYSSASPWPVESHNTRSSAVAAADFNGDGHLDLALSNRDILLGNGDGTFQPGQSYNPGGFVSVSALAADFSGDGKPDLTITGSSQVTILVNVSIGFQQTTSTTLSSSRNPANVHHKVTLTATVTSSSVTPTGVTPAAAIPAGVPRTGAMPSGAGPTGSVTFSDGSRALGTVSLVNGKAEFSTSSLEAGVHPITATYSGDESFNTSTSAELDQVIRAETRTVLTSSKNPSHRGKPVTFTAAISANSGETPTGKVTFRDFFTVLATVQLSGGQASFTTSKLCRGPHAIRGGLRRQHD